MFQNKILQKKNKKINSDFQLCTWEHRGTHIFTPLDTENYLSDQRAELRPRPQKWFAKGSQFFF